MPQVEELPARPQVPPEGGLEEGEGTPRAEEVEVSRRVQDTTVLQLLGVKDNHLVFSRGQVPSLGYPNLASKVACF